jgi:hypothetical protein
MYTAQLYSNPAFTYATLTVTDFTVHRNKGYRIPTAILTNSAVYVFQVAKFLPIRIDYQSLLIELERQIR